jgi:nitrous oxide reductase accessory protein NosL
MGRMLIGLAAFGIVACSSIRPVPVQAGDVCVRCQRTVVDARLAGEIIDAQGTALKFRAPLCMAKYLRRHPAEAAAIYVTDYTTGEMFPAMNGTFVRVALEGSEREYAAFRSPTDAARFMKEHGGGVVDWVAVQRVAMEATD